MKNVITGALAGLALGGCAASKDIKDIKDREEPLKGICEVTLTTGEKATLILDKVYQNGYLIDSNDGLGARGNCENGMTYFHNDVKVEQSNFSATFEQTTDPNAIDTINTLIAKNTK